MKKIQYTGNKLVDFYIRQRARVLTACKVNYTQPWFLRARAHENARLLRVATSIVIVSVAIPIGISKIQKKHNLDPASRKTDLDAVLAQIEDEAVLSRLNCERKAAGLPPVPYLLDEHGEPHVVAAASGGAMEQGG